MPAMRRRGLPLLLAAVLLGLGSLPALALIKINFPVSRIYGDSKAVLAASVVAVNVEQRMVEAKVTQTLKGGLLPERIRIQIAAPADLIGKVAVNQPVLVFSGSDDGQGPAILHVADTWLLSQGIPGASPPGWQAVQVYDAARSFPGTSASLLRMVSIMKGGLYPLDDTIEPACLEGPVRALTNLAVRPVFFEAGDINNDGRVDLLVGTIQGVRLLLGTRDGYSDSTDAWGLKGATGAHAAIGDANGDGKADLLLGSSLFLRTGDRFVRAATVLDLPPESDWLSVALADATGDQRADVVVLRRDGECLVLQNPDATDKPWTRSARRLWQGGSAATALFARDWGEDTQLQTIVVNRDGLARYPANVGGGPAADFLHLTGTAFPPDLVSDKTPSFARLVALDFDGNGKSDLMLLTDNGGVTLLNRGFGAFCADYTIHRKLQPEKPGQLPFSLTPGAFLAPGQRQKTQPPRQNLLVLTEDGRLFEMQNTVIERP